MPDWKADSFQTAVIAEFIMSHQTPALHKRRTREHIIADLGINHVERQALLSGNTVQRWLHDYGLDLVLSTYTDEGEPDGGKMFMQVKATDHLKTVSGGRFVACRIERAHLRAWLAEPMPVFLIVYDAPNDRCYWLYIQAAFPGPRRFRAASGSETLTIRIPAHQILDPSAVRRFRAFGQTIAAQYQGAFHEQE